MSGDVLETYSASIPLLLSLGGAAYLPETIVQPHIESKQLHWVNDAPVFEHAVHAVFPVRTGRQELIDSMLVYFPL